MAVLLLGATGLIGSAVAVRLNRDGHGVVGVARSLGTESRRLPVGRWIELDLRRIEDPNDWLPHLVGIDAVVNCAGTLQDSARDSTDAVHRTAPAALWRACEAAGVRRVIQVSAIGVDRGGATSFSRTKREGDKALEQSALDWAILRPSVVVGRQAYGGSALFRGLASLPVLPRTPDSGPLDIVQLDDVVETIARLLRPGAPSRVAIELAGPDRLTFEEAVAAYRRWFGWRPARLVILPGWAMARAWRVGDAIAWLGWRPPIRTTARREIQRGAIGDGSEWARLTGIEPQSLATALGSEPASVQERWFARLYFLKPLAIGIFALFWLATGLVSLGPGYAHAVSVMRGTDAAAIAELSVVAGAAVDIVIAFLILFRRTSRLGLILALAVSILYVIAGTLLIPGLWADPLGPMLKIWPILALNLVCLAILEER
ncbi:SDR family oxidoreductase [Allosphingosinicella sp.]|uniref:SDR family oxidoreductase n=1 Tax=Allosphingosinicella sp. TaxID=2823234 RepID=UPI002F2137F8